MGYTVDQGRKIQLLENKDMAMMELKAMQHDLLDTQKESNALAGQMKEVENGMVRYSSLFDLMLALHGEVARAPREAAKDRKTEE